MAHKVPIIVLDVLFPSWWSINKHTIAYIVTHTFFTTSNCQVIGVTLARWYCIVHVLVMKPSIATWNKPQFTESKSKTSVCYTTSALLSWVYAFSNWTTNQQCHWERAWHTRTTQCQPVPTIQWLQSNKKWLNDEWSNF